MDLWGWVVVVDLGPHGLAHTKRLAYQPAAEARQRR